MHLATVSDVVKVADRLHVAPGRAPLDNTYTARVVHSVRAKWCRGQAKTWAAQATCQSRKAPGRAARAAAVGGVRGFCSLVAAGRSCLQLVARFEHWHMPSFTPTLFMYQPGHHHPADPDVSATSGGWRGPRQGESPRTLANCQILCAARPTVDHWGSPGGQSVAHPGQEDPSF